jgi:hypothetical protein
LGVGVGGLTLLLVGWWFGLVLLIVQVESED